MCTYQELYRGEEGYVIRCNGCNRYQALYGNVVLSMTEEEFQKFTQVVAVYQADCVIASASEEVPVPTARQGVHLLLNRQKITQLHAMLQGADAEAQTQRLLQLFQP